MFYVRCRQGFFFSDVSNLAEEKRQGVNKKKKLGKKSASFLLCTLKPFYLSLEWEEVILPLFNSSPSRFEFPIVWEFPVSTLSHAGAKHSSGPSLHPCIDPCLASSLLRLSSVSASSFHIYSLVHMQLASPGNKAKSCPILSWQ